MTSYFTPKEEAKQPKFFGREPVLWTTVITAGVSVAAAFGFELDGEQVAAITSLTVAVFGLVTRQKVSPTYKVADGHAAGEETLGE